MEKLFWCRLCLTEIEPIALADGTMALVCLDCDLIGLAHEIDEGSRTWPARLHPRPVRSRGRSSSERRKMAGTRTPGQTE
jgi:hypothetical protein